MTTHNPSRDDLMKYYNWCSSIVTAMGRQLSETHGTIGGCSIIGAVGKERVPHTVLQDIERILEQNRSLTTEIERLQSERLNAMRLASYINGALRYGIETVNDDGGRMLELAKSAAEVVYDEDEHSRLEGAEMQSFLRPSENA